MALRRFRQLPSFAQLLAANLDFGKRRESMRSGKTAWLAALIVGWFCGATFGQEKGAPPAPAAAASPAVAPTGVAATVNGQVIPEVAVQRALKRVPPDKQAEARIEIVRFLIDNTLVDQYVAQQKITADPKEVEAKLKQVQEDMKKQGASFDKMMKDLMLTEAELRSQIENQLRWEKFAAGQISDQGVKDFFEHNKAMFDGSMVHARHILLSPTPTDAKAVADAKARLAAMKKQVEEAAAKSVAQLPAQTDNLEREKIRRKAIDDTFAALARKESACPSRTNGGDLDWFPFASMVEPFARAAFALKPYEMSDVVATQFGYHLILVTDRREGKEPKFETVKDDVREVCSDMLRESLCAKVRPTAQVVITPPAAKPAAKP
jgi:peptidyl-prolyl cis-trans isomerase C